MPHPWKAVAFDVDDASLLSLREALPGWQFQVVNGATAASLTSGWNPGTADFLIVKAREEDIDETLGLCRFLACCTTFSSDSRTTVKETLRRNGSLKRSAPRPDAPLLVLVPPDQEGLVRAALKAGATRCLVLPVHPKEVVTMLVHARADNHPGRHTLNLHRAQSEDHWRDDGGQG